MEEWTDLALMGVGAALKGAAAGFIKQFLPDVTDDVAAIILGGAAYYFRDRIPDIAVKIGTGVLIAGIAGIVEPMIPKIGGGGSKSTPTKSPQDLAALARAEATRTAVYS